MLMFGGGHVSWLYLGLGIIASGLVALASGRLKLVEKNSELLYLSVGFYRHFCAIFFKNFFSSIFLILNMALRNKELKPSLHRIKLRENLRFNPALLMASFNMSTGVFCVDVKEKEILVHAIDQTYFQKFDLQKICLNLRDINDDNLI